MKKSLRVISVVLSILMIISILTVAPIVAQARAVESPQGDENGSTGDCKWSLFTSSKTLIVTGEGRMEDYTKAAPWRSFSESIENIIIDDGVEYIGKYAFRELPDLRYVYIASSVKEVGEASFFDCTSLRNVVMSDGTKTIDTLAFENTGLKSISVPATVTSIGNYSLGYDENKENYSYIPVAGFTIKGEAGSAAQEYATKYGFTFLNSDKAIDHLDLTVDKENFALDTEKKESDYDEVTEGVFYNTGVTTEGCQTIGSDTCYLYYYDGETYSFKPVPFKDAENINPDKQYCILYIVGLNNGYDWTSAVKKFSGEYMDIREMDGFSLSLNEEEFTDAFISYNSYNNTLSVLVSYDNFLTHEFEVEELSDGTLKITKYNGSDGDVFIPEEIGGKKVSVIGYEAFFGCHSTKCVEIPDTVKEIEEKAFYYCGVESVFLNDGLEKVGDNAFCTNFGLEEVTIPASVTTIGDGAFGTRVGDGYNPEKMESFIIYGEKGSAAENYAEENGFKFIDVTPTSKVTITYDLNGGTVTEDASEGIKKQFEETGKIIIEVNAGAEINFKKDVLAKTIVPPEGKEYDAIEVDGTRYEFEQSFTVSGDTAIKFLWKDKETVTHTVTYDFNGGTLRGKVENPKTVNDGTMVDFTGELSYILDMPLGNVLDYVTVDGEKCETPDNYIVTKDITVKYFWKNAPTSGKVGDCSWSFDKNTGILTVSGGKSIPDMFSYSPWYPFRDEIKQVVIGDGVETIGSFAFHGLSKLTSVILPSSLTNIYNGAFASTGLDHITIPNSKTEIGMYAVGYDVDILTLSVTPVKDFTVYAEKGSKAAEYAGNNSFKSEDLSKAPVEKVKEDEPEKKAEVKKSANTIKVTVKTKSLKAKKLKKKKQTVKSLTIKNAKGSVTCKIVKKGTASKIYKKIKINKKGVITFKKGKYAKKTYKIKVKITAAGNDKYNKKTVTKTVKVKVK